VLNQWPAAYMAEPPCASDRFWRSRADQTDHLGLEGKRCCNSYLVSSTLPLTQRLHRRNGSGAVVCSQSLVRRFILMCHHRERGVLMVRTISLWHVARQNAHWYQRTRTRAFPVDTSADSPRRDRGNLSCSTIPHRRCPRSSLYRTH